MTGEGVGSSDDQAGLQPAASVTTVWRGAGSVAHWRVLEGPARVLVRRAWQTVETPADRAALRRSLGREPDDRMTQPAHRIVGPCLPKAVRDAADDGVCRGGMAEIAAVERAFYMVAALIAAQPRSAREEGPADSVAPVDASAEVPGVDTQSVPSEGNEPEATPAGQAAAAETAGGTASAPGAGHSRPGGAGRSLGRCLADAVNAAPPRERGDLYGRLDARLRLLCRQDVDGLHRHLPRLVRQLPSDKITVDWVRLLLDLAYWGVDADLVAKVWLQQFYGYARPAGLDRPAPADSASDQSDTSVANGGAVNNGETKRP
ncbi:type I-E CRISPR-associated protein Cse2/CasB [Frankia sp. KB5]|uniref:type I-E CRISPR-associated protein Cse2/CasB n=1 Tax=Frankia sp. KB5 TaxID=683318 RepID=UPI0012FFA511|nr:type I-E CRISPR-associated protein Cse2/CasB [Frankia sp. KB5]